jgi:hypothetical protein
MDGRLHLDRAARPRPGQAHDPDEHGRGNARQRPKQASRTTAPVSPGCFPRTVHRERRRVRFPGLGRDDLSRSSARGLAVARWRWSYGSGVVAWNFRSRAEGSLGSTRWGTCSPQGRLPPLGRRAASRAASLGGRPHVACPSEGQPRSTSARTGYTRDVMPAVRLLEERTFHPPRPVEVQHNGPIAPVTKDYRVPRRGGDQRGSVVLFTPVSRRGSTEARWRRRSRPRTTQPRRRQAAAGRPRHPGTAPTWSTPARPR